jgi:hypothetical protein
MKGQNRAQDVADITTPSELFFNMGLHKIVWIQNVTEHQLRNRTQCYKHSNHYIHYNVTICNWNSKFKLDKSSRKRTTRLFSFHTTWTAQKTSPRILHCRGKVFAKLLPSNVRGIHRQSHRHTRSNNSSTVSFIRCHGNVFTEPLPSNERRDIYI